MKISQLKSIVKEAVKEAIQEEMKDILLKKLTSIPLLFSIKFFNTKLLIKIKSRYRFL